SLCHWLTSKGEEKLNNFFDRVLEKDEEGESKRAVSDLYEQLKDYFDNLQVDFKEKFAKFGEWVKHLVETGMEKSKNKVENVRNVALEFKRKIISYPYTIDIDTQRAFSHECPIRRYLWSQWQFVAEKNMENLTYGRLSADAHGAGLIAKSKHLSKEVAAEALEFLHQFKDELGHLYDEARDKLMQKILDYTD
ncbi:uncharacterized protein TNIN_83461, partial [Trichonephila inaurata madagascariensis]